MHAGGWARIYNKPVYVIGPHREGWDVALAAVLKMIDDLVKVRAERDDLDDRNQKMGELLRGMPTNNSILKNGSLKHGNKMGAEYIVYGMYGKVKAVADDPFDALMSAFGRVSTDGE